jgi:hypothetical protein
MPPDEQPSRGSHAKKPRASALEPQVNLVNLKESRLKGEDYEGVAITPPPSAGQHKINVEKADCFKAEDKEMILREIREKHGSTKIFDTKLKNKLSDVELGLN